MKSTLILFSLALGLYGASPEINAKKAGMDPEALARIPARLQTFVDRGAISGAVTLVQRHGALASLEAVGYQDLESKKPMAKDTIFEIYSMTKAVTATAAMMLVDEGKLVLSDPVEKYLPEFRGMWMIDGKSDAKQRVLKRPGHRITVRELLNHTSGMPTNPSEGAKELTLDSYSGGGTKLVLKAHLSLAEAVLMYSQLPLEFEPGSRFMYSNTGIATVGRIIEVLSGMSYEQFMLQRIFQPLGMTDTFFYPPEDKKARIAMVYQMVNGKLKPYGDMIYRKGARYPIPEGGMYTTAADLVKFYQMLLNGGSWNGKRMISRAAIELMTTNHLGTLPVFGSQAHGWGLGWHVVRAPEGQLDMTSIGTYGHSGAAGTKGYADPKLDLITLFLVQRVPGGSTDEIFHSFEALVHSSIVQ